MQSYDVNDLKLHTSKDAYSKLGQSHSHAAVRKPNDSVWHRIIYLPVVETPLNPCMTQWQYCSLISMSTLRVCVDHRGSSSLSKTHLVLMIWVRDVIGHVARRMRQDDHHVIAGGGRGTQPVCLGLDEWGQLVSAELILRLGQAWGHLTWGTEVTNEELGSLMYSWLKSLWLQVVFLVGLSKHSVMDSTHRVWGDADECKGLAGQGNEVGPSSASNRLVSQRCFCTGTEHILQTHRYAWKKPFVLLNGAKLRVSCTAFTMSNVSSHKCLVLGCFSTSVPFSVSIKQSLPTVKKIFVLFSAAVLNTSHACYAVTVSATQELE